MDPKAPRTATATLVLGMVTWILSVVSVVFKLGLTPGFNIEEIVLLAIGAFFFLISFFASREREQMEMIQSLSVEEQFAAIESQPTKYKSSTTTTDHHGFETQNNSDSQTIIASILGGASAQECEFEAADNMGNIEFLRKVTQAGYRGYIRGSYLELDDIISDECLGDWMPEQYNKLVNQA